MGQTHTLLKELDRQRTGKYSAALGKTIDAKGGQNPKALIKMSGLLPWLAVIFIIALLGFNVKLLTTADKDAGAAAKKAGRMIEEQGILNGKIAELERNISHIEEGRKKDRQAIESLEEARKTIARRLNMLYQKADNT